MRRLAEVPAGASSAETARILYPDNIEYQQEYLALVPQVDAVSLAVDPNSRVAPDALPAVLAPYLIVLGRCAVGALSSAALAAVYERARRGDRLGAEALVDAAVTGCIGSVLPPFLRGIARRSKRFIVAAVLSIIIRLS